MTEALPQRLSCVDLVVTITNGAGRGKLRRHVSGRGDENLPSVWKRKLLSKKMYEGSPHGVRMGRIGLKLALIASGTARCTRRGTRARVP